MKNRQYPLSGIKSRISILIILANAVLLTACAGQQTAQELAGLEMSTMLEYKQLINKTISEENTYYKTASEQLSNNLKQMKNDVDIENTLVRRAVRYDDLWHKNPPSQHDVLVMIDTAYADLEETEKEFNTHLNQINEQYFSKIEKLAIQQDNINKSIAALSKLYAGDELKDQANLIKDRVLDTAKTARKLIEDKK